jgi:uncharacterized membrane protein
MSEIERSVTVAAAPDEVFAFVSDVRRLPDYMDHMTAARPEQGDVVHVEADVEGDHEVGDAWFHVLAEERRVEWGSRRAGSDYRGFIEVAAADDASRVTLGINLHHDEAAPSVERTLANVKRLVEA